jgi:hypothetical protein
MIAFGFITICAIMMSLSWMLHEPEPKSMEETPVEIEIDGVTYYGIAKQDKLPREIVDHG